jgi:hypothetical protein
MSPRAGYLCAALMVALCAGLACAPVAALADSGGYRRPDISAHYGSASGAASWAAPSSGGYRRPSTTGGGYYSGSAGDLAFSRSTSAQALAQYRLSQQPRRPPVVTETTRDTGWGYGGYASRRPSFTPTPVVVGGSGGFGSAAFWAMLGALSASDRATYFQRSQEDPGYQQWRQQAARDPTTAARLAALGGGASAAPSSGAAATDQGSGGSFIVLLVIFIGAAAFVLLWVARRRPMRPAATAPPPGISGSATTRFRVGQTIPLDPAPFLLAAGVTKVQPPPGGGMISVEAVGLLSDGQAQLHRLYLPGRTGFFQLHLGADGAPDECRYFSRLDEVQPADQAEWGQWLDPAQGMIGWPAFQTKDGQTYDRSWGPGQSRIPPRQLTETLQALSGQSQRSLQAMLYARPTGAAPPAPQGEYVMVAAVEDAGQAWVEIVAGIDVNPAALTLPAVPIN